MKRYLPFVIIGAVLVLAVGAGALMFRSSQPNPVSPTPTPVASGAPQSSPAAKGIVTLEEFGDYQCPPCGIVYPMIKKVKSEFGPSVRLIFYHLPLTQMHKNALDAAHAAVAAGLQGRFWEMHDQLYETQKEWSEAPDIHPYTLGYASKIGLDVARFTRDMDSQQVDAIVQADLQRAASRGVNATPTIFIDGQMFDNDKLSVENLRKEIAQKLGLQR